MAIRVRQPDHIKVRIEHLFWILVACYLGLVVRLVYLQVVQGDFLRNKARQLRAQLIRQVAQRGAILDRDGKPLAVTLHSNVLMCDPTQVKDPARTSQAVATVFGGRAEEVVPFLTKRLLPNGKQDRSVVVPISLDPDAPNALNRMRGDAKQAPDFAGLSITDKPNRSYPAGHDAAQVIGFVIPGPDGKPQGRAGLEQSLDSALHGHDGYIKAEVDARRRVIPDTQVDRKDAADGVDVRTTIDTTIQHIVATELEACYQKYHPAGATAIVLDPKTGEVLAMVSAPDFDPVKRDELKKNPDALRNRALTLFEPGSTMKIITAAAALEQGVITPTTEFVCEGSVRIGNRTVKCAAHGGSSAHGVENISKIIAESCNCASAIIGTRIGMDRLVPYLQRFGLLDPTGVGLPADYRGRLGFGADALSGGIGKVARMAFGQAVMVTPLELAAAYAAIANHGQLMRPRLVKAFQDSSGKTIRQFPPVPVRQAVKPETAAYLTELLEGVVKHGTGESAAVRGYTVAGKTGTAQKVVPGHLGYAGGKYVASFIGFLPAHDPKALIYVVVDEPQGAYYGAQVAAPVFQSVAQRLMWYWKAPPDDPASLEKPVDRTARR